MASFAYWILGLLIAGVVLGFAYATFTPCSESKFGKYLSYLEFLQDQSEMDNLMTADADEWLQPLVSKNTVDLLPSVAMEEENLKSNFTVSEIPMEMEGPITELIAALRDTSDKNLEMQQEIPGSSPQILDVASCTEVEVFETGMHPVANNHNITFDCKYHVVFCPKYRRKVLTPPIDLRLKELFQSKVSELQAEIVEMEIMPDHVHLLITCDPQFGIHRMVKHLKGYTSRTLRQEFKELTSRSPSLWTNSYFVATVGSISLDTVNNYIENQEEK